MGPVGPVELDEVQLVLATAPARRHRSAAAPALWRGVRRHHARRARDGVRRRVRARARRESLPREDRRGSDPARRRSAVGSVRACWRPKRSARPPSGWRSGSPSARRAGASACRTRASTSRRARPRVPSFYALEVLRAAEGRLPSFDEPHARRRARGGCAARLAGARPAVVGHRRGRVRPRAAGAAARCRSRHDHRDGVAICSAPTRIWRARSARAAGAGCGAGRRPTASSIRAIWRARRSLAHQLDRRSFSPTALQHFAACPYRFFLQAIHRLAPREEPVAIEVLDPLTRGALFHDVQFGVLEGLRDGGLLPLRPAGLERAFDVLERCSTRREGRPKRGSRPPSRACGTTSSTAMRADLREWLRRLAADESGWVPERFELSFGLPPDEREHRDPASVAEPVAVDGSA